MRIIPLIPKHKLMFSTKQTRVEHLNKQYCVLIGSATYYRKFNTNGQKLQLHGVVITSKQIESKFVKLAMISLSSRYL